MCQTLFFSYLILNCWKVSSGQSYDNMTGLLSAVLSGYNSDVRPLEQQSRTMMVNLSLILYNVLEVDTVTGSITVVMALPCTWYDERIRWNSSHYGGIDSIKIQQQYVWTPGLVNTQPTELSSVGEKWMRVDYQPNGVASWIPAGVYKLSCPMEIKHWPFDEQKCDLSFLSYGYSDRELLLQPGNMSTEFLPKNGEWELTGSSISTTHRFGQNEVVFTIQLKRHVIFYLDTLILPLLFLAILGIFGFLLPTESGERISYSITILLSLTIFLDVISDDIPKSSKPIPLFCLFLNLAVSINALVTILVVVNLWLYHRSDKVPEGKFYRFVVKVARCGRKNTVGAENKQQSQEDQQSQDELFKKTKMSELMYCSSVESFDETVRYDTDNDKDNNNEETLSVDREEEWDITWQDVSVALDRIIFFTTICTTTIATILMTLTMTLKL